MISSEVWMEGVGLCPQPLKRPDTLATRVGHSVRSPLPRGSTDHAAKVASPETRIFVCEHVGIYGAKCRIRLVPETVVKGLDDIFLEAAAAWVGANDGLPLRLGVVGIGKSQHIHLDARGEQRDDRVHMWRNPRCGVQCDRCPNRVYGLLRNASAPQEVASGVGSVDLEAIVLAAVLASETHVMKHRSRVEQFGIEPQPLTLSRQRAPMVNAARMVKKKRGFRVPHQLGYFTSNLAIGDRNLVYCRHH